MGLSESISEAPQNGNFVDMPGLILGGHAAGYFAGGHPPRRPRRRNGRGGGEVPPGRVISLGTYLRGFETWLIDMIQNPSFAEALLDRGLEIQMATGGKWLSAAGQYIDVLHISDDLGTQRSPMISPLLYRKLIKPRQMKLFKFIRESTNAKILLHSDGCVYPFIEDFLEAGIEILNPLQSGVKDMELRKLGEEFGGRLCFWGGIDTQHTLPFGTPQDVKNEVTQRILELGLWGGYVLSASHNIQNDVDPENVCAMFESARQYPL